MYTHNNHQKGKRMKKAWVNPAPSKYKPSYGNNKSNSNNLEKEEAQKRREFGIKANYKKVLRKQDKLFGSRQEGGVEAASPSVHATSNWTVSSTNNDRGNDKGPNQNTRQNDHYAQRQYKQQDVKDKWKGAKPSAMKKAQTEFRKKKNEKSESLAAAKRSQEERTVAIENRKKKRLEKFKILNQKTSKGQPVMKGRINLLLDKIKSRQ